MSLTGARSTGNAQHETRTLVQSAGMSGDSLSVSVARMAERMLALLDGGSIQLRQPLQRPLDALQHRLCPHATQKFYETS